MKSWQPINFTACAKDWGLVWKLNLQNYHIWLITPVQLLHNLHNISESPGWRGKLKWPRYFDIPTCRCPWQLFYQTINFHSVTWYPIGVRNACETLAKGKIHWKSLKIIGNDQKLSQMSGNDQNWSPKVRIGHVTPVTCDTIMWSSANDAKMQKYMNREPWGSSACGSIHNMLPLIFAEDVHYIDWIFGM